MWRTIESSDLFKCKKCGECCKGYGGTYVTPHDIKMISEFINTDPECFITEYCKMSGKRPVLAQGKDGYCIFWDKLCTIHPVKPRMCREWPFIRSVLLDVKNWKIMAGSCPGIQTDFPDETIKAIVEKEILSRDLSNI